MLGHITLLYISQWGSVMVKSRCETEKNTSSHLPLSCKLTKCVNVPSARSDGLLLPHYVVLPSLIFYLLISCLNSLSLFSISFYFVSSLSLRYLVFFCVISSFYFVHLTQCCFISFSPHLILSSHLPLFSISFYFVKSFSSLSCLLLSCLLSCPSHYLFFHLFLICFSSPSHLVLSHVLLFISSGLVSLLSLLHLFLTSLISSFSNLYFILCCVISS